MRPWSYSRLSCYETCPLQYRYRYVEDLRGSRPPNPAASRGTAIHAEAEKYLNGGMPIYPPDLQKVAGHAMLLKTKGAKSEQKLAVTDKWEPCDYESTETYLRAIIDIIYVDGEVVHVQDWKTGQVYDSHKAQLDTYVAVAAAHHPEAKAYHARAVYIDQGIVSIPKITAAERVKPIRLLLDGRVKSAEEDTIFPSRHGSHCKWCDYSRKWGGPCAHG